MKVTRRDVPSPRGARPRASVIAQEKAVEKQQVRYFRLACGHYTSLAVDEVYEAFRALEKGLGPLWHYCESCGHWRRKWPKQKKTQYPPEPLF